MKGKMKIVAVSVARPGACGCKGHQDDAKRADKASPRDHSRTLPSNISRRSTADKGE